MATEPLCQYLPEEVIEHILAKIPCTKFILRCTLVCKLWYVLIKSSQFINTHLSSPNNTKYLLFEHIFEFGSNYSLYVDWKSLYFFPLVFPRGLKHVKVHGCCNGVICYTKRHETRGNIYLWNPFVRKLKILPEFREKDDGKDAKETIGFWFDNEKRDYEVVKITYTEVASCVDVYSLRTNSWKIISDSCPGAPSTIEEHNVVYAKGKLYWLSENWQGCRIISLNLNNAMFREALISTPISLLTGVIFKPCYLKGLDGNSLVILRMNYKGWMCIMKVHEESLELLDTDVHKILNNQEVDLLGFRNNGEALLCRSHSSLSMRIIKSYDLGAKQLTDFDFFRGYPVLAHPLVETLVLLNESNADLSGWDRMVGIFKTLVVKLLDCEWWYKI